MEGCRGRVVYRAPASRPGQSSAHNSTPATCTQVRCLALSDPGGAWTALVVRPEDAAAILPEGLAEAAGRIEALIGAAGAGAQGNGAAPAQNGSGPVPLQAALGPARPGEPEPPAIFRREGDVWAIAFSGESFRLRDLKGLRYLARLLAEPGRELHCLDLVAAERAGERPPPEAKGPEPGLDPGSLGDAGEILDPEAKGAYRERLTELERELEEARLLRDPERRARAEVERQQLESELARACGLGGRDRRACSASERARVAVRQAIRTALERIADHGPALAEHLERTVRTGTFCAYEPDPRAPVRWRV